jgi:Terminase small subunit
MAKNLTLKQQKFLELRLEKGLKGAEAYRQAYGSKMSPPLCAKQAYRLLHNPKIKAYLDRAEKVAESRIETAIADDTASRSARHWRCSFNTVARPAPVLRHDVLIRSPVRQSSSPARCPQPKIPGHLVCDDRSSAVCQKRLDDADREPDGAAIHLKSCAR